MNKSLTTPSVLDEVDVPLTIESLKATMPSRQKANITKGLVKELNNLISEPEHRDFFRQNILGYTDVLKDPKTTLPGYIKAVKYVSYKLMGMTNQDAWMRTFPERFDALTLRNAKPEYIRSLVCAYNKGQLVNKILEQTMIPTWVLNQDVYQKGVNVLADLMVTAVSEKVRSDSASSLLQHLAVPVASKLSVDVTMTEDESIKDLRKAMTDLVRDQQDAIRAGTRDARQIAESVIVEGESVRIEDDS